MSLCTGFVLFDSKDGANIRLLSRLYGISPANGYKWLQRWAHEGPSGLHNRSCTPHYSLNRSSEDITALLRMAYWKTQPSMTRVQIKKGPLFPKKQEAAKLAQTPSNLVQLQVTGTTNFQANQIVRYPPIELSPPLREQIAVVF